MRATMALMMLLGTMVTVAGCHKGGGGIDTAAGCDDKLAAAHKKKECHACVESSKVYMPEKADGQRCVAK